MLQMSLWEFSPFFTGIVNYRKTRCSWHPSFFSHFRTFYNSVADHITIFLYIWKLAVKAPEKLGLGRLSFWDRLPVRYELLVLRTIISNRKWNNCVFGVNFFAPRFLFGSCWFDFSKNCLPPPNWSMFFPSVWEAASCGDLNFLAPVTLS